MTRSGGFSRTVSPSTRSEQLFFRYLDPLSYLLVRRGHIQWTEVVRALPGWTGTPTALSALPDGNWSTVNALQAWALLRANLADDAQYWT